MSVEENNQDNIEETEGTEGQPEGMTDEEILDELKEYATDIGVEFNPNIGFIKLKERVDAFEEEIAEKQKAKKAKKEAAKKAIKDDKVKIIVESRDGDDAPSDQFFGYQSMETGQKEHILIQFGEEIEVSRAMYNHIKSIKFGEKKFKIVPDEDGVPRKHWYTKKKPRFIVSRVDED